MKDWLRLRSYIHLSPRLKAKDKKAVKCLVSSYVKNKENVVTHRFTPLLHYNIIDHKYRRDKSQLLSNGNVGRSYKVKRRPIYYANHLDSQVFAYYSYLINQKLKVIYQSDEDLNNAVIGYRTIESSSKRNKCTVDFAKEVFDYILHNDATELTVFCLDIASFFDNLDHEILKQMWAELFGELMLSRDHYQVFKAVTNPYYIDLEELITLIPDFDKRRINLLKNSKHSALFKSFEHFRLLIRAKKLLRQYNPTRSQKGIPQGTPISATLSNLYFLTSDIEIVNKIKSLGGLYRRYSDDILVVCPTELSNEVIATIRATVEAKLKLQIQDSKTITANFSRDSRNSSWDVEVLDSKGEKINRAITYLGFDFDGVNIRLRNSSISKYYRSLKRAIRRRAFYAMVQVEKNKKSEVQKDAWIYRAGIFRQKTHLGSKRKKIGRKVFWGNYISYTKSAANIMGDSASIAIKKQLKNHWKVTSKEIAKFESKYGLPKAPKSTRYT